jgi:transcriptional regulator with XRE-family HTH domain
MTRLKTIPSARLVLARNLRRLRASKELSQEALADMAGLHRTYVGSVERYERNISIDSIEKLSVALGVTISELLAEENE